MRFLEQARAFHGEPCLVGDSVEHGPFPFR